MFEDAANAEEKKINTLQQCRQSEKAQNETPPFINIETKVVCLAFFLHKQVEEDIVNVEKKKREH